MNVHVATSIGDVSAELPALGEQLRKAYEAEIAAEKIAPPNIDLDRFTPYIVAYERCEALVTRIEAIEPRTFLDFGVKMLAVAWARGEDAFASQSREAEDYVARDTRILESFIPAILQATGMMPSRADEAAR